MYRDIAQYPTSKVSAMIIVLDIENSVAVSELYNSKRYDSRAIHLIYSSQLRNLISSRSSHLFDLSFPSFTLSTPFPPHTAFACRFHISFQYTIIYLPVSHFCVFCRCIFLACRIASPLSFLTASFFRLSSPSLSLSLLPPSLFLSSCRRLFTSHRSFRLLCLTFP